MTMKKFATVGDLLGLLQNVAMNMPIEVLIASEDCPDARAGVNKSEYDGSTVFQINVER